MGLHSYPHCGILFKAGPGHFAAIGNIRCVLPTFSRHSAVPLIYHINTENVTFDKTSWTLGTEPGTARNGNMIADRCAMRVQTTERTVIGGQLLSPSLLPAELKSEQQLLEFNEGERNSISSVSAQLNFSTFKLRISKENSRQHQWAACWHWSIENDSKYSFLNGPFPVRFSFTFVLS